MKTALRIGILASSCFLLGGCALFGLSAQEQSQIQVIRQLKKSLVPGVNKPLNEFCRAWGYIADFDLPTEYGIDLTNYFSLLPFQGAGDLADRKNPPAYSDSQKREIKTIIDSKNSTQFEFSPYKASSNSRFYEIKFKTTRLPGVSGTFSVTTTATRWEPSTTPIPTNGRYGGGEITKTPQSVAINMSGLVSGKPVLIKGQAQLGGQMTPTTGTFEMQLPDIAFKADSVRFTAQNNVTMSGTLGIGPEADGNVFQGTVTLNGGTIEGNFNNPKHKYSVSFNYDGSVLTAEFKSSGNNSKNLAVIDFENERQVMKFADGGVDDFPLKVTK